MTQGAYASVLERLGQLDRAAALYQQNLDEALEILDGGHLNLGFSYAQLAACQLRMATVLATVSEMVATDPVVVAAAQEDVASKNSEAEQRVGQHAAEQRVGHAEDAVRNFYAALEVHRTGANGEDHCLRGARNVLQAAVVWEELRASSSSSHSGSSGAGANDLVVAQEEAGSWNDPPRNNTLSSDVAGAGGVTPTSEQSVFDIKRKILSEYGDLAGIDSALKGLVEREESSGVASGVAESGAAVARYHAGVGGVRQETMGGC